MEIVALSCSFIGNRWKSLRYRAFRADRRAISESCKIVILSCFSLTSMEIVILLRYFLVNRLNLVSGNQCKPLCFFIGNRWKSLYCLAFSLEICGNRRAIVSLERIVGQFPNLAKLLYNTFRLESKGKGCTSIVCVGEIFALLCFSVEHR